jgi:hypothetical protein
MYYVEQHPSYNLGNFINCTPALRYLAERDGKPVPVLFHTDYVRQCFLDCPFIEHIEVPVGRRLFGSEMVNRRNTMPDYAWIFEQVTAHSYRGQYHTYVDQPGAPAKFPIPVIVNGSGSEREAYVASKDVGPEPYMAAGSALFVGSEADLARNPWAESFHVGDIRQALGYIADAPCVIANDTGLAHAAGAMNKPLLVLWKDTPFPRCGNPGKNTTYAFDNHVEAVREFVATHGCN